MSIQPLITFKAGRCDVDSASTPWSVKPARDEGYLYLYMGADDEMVHFCWRPRSAQVDDPNNMDLLMIPGDCTFAPYTGKESSASSDNVTSPVGGRIFVLKFSSSSQRHFFWLQSASQHPDKKVNWFSPRDLKIGQIVDMMLQGVEVDVQEEMADVAREEGGDDDEEMEDADETSHMLRRSSTGGAGADATGGDVREEGSSGRDGGADGGRASSTSQNQDASSIVQNFLRSLGASNQASSSNPSRQQEKLYTTLSDLLTPDTCVPIISSAQEAHLDTLLTLLPPQILLLSQTAEDLTSPEIEPTPDATAAAIAALSIGQKKSILTRVLRSPQLHQSLSSLTQALRDGGLPLVAQSLGLKVGNGGNVKGGNVPLGGGNAVEAFVEGVKRTVEEEDAGKKQGGDSMDTS